MKTRRRLSLEERFWAKVKKTDGCWVWTGSAQHNGYGYLHIGDKTNRKPMRAHRVSWELHNGPIPTGLWVLHRCDNPPCVRPEHLWLGDRTDNMRDCAAKGRVRVIGKSRLKHCKRGHEFSSENTRIRPNGHRACRICQTMHQENRRELRRARSAR